MPPVAAGAPFVLPEDDDDDVASEEDPFVPIALRLRPDAGPLRFAIPPPTPGSLRPPIPLTPIPPPTVGIPGVEADRDAPPGPMAIGPAEPTRPTAPPVIIIGEGRPGPLCPSDGCCDEDDEGPGEEDEGGVDD